MREPLILLFLILSIVNPSRLAQPQVPYQPCARSANEGTRVGPRENEDLIRPIKGAHNLSFKGMSESGNSRCFRLCAPVPGYQMDG